MATIKNVRCTSVKLKADAQIKRRLDDTLSWFHKRAKEYSEIVLAMLQQDVNMVETVYDRQTRKSKRLVVHRGVEYWREILRQKLGRYDRLELVKRAATTIMIGKDHENPTKPLTLQFMHPIRQVARCGSEILADFRTLQDEGVLPVTMSVPFHTNQLDKAAWEMAMAALTSWYNRDCEARKNYRAAEEAVELAKPSDEDIAMFESFITQTELDITGKLIYRMERYGFDVSYCKPELAVAEGMCDSAEKWIEIFNWKLKEKKLKKLSKSAKCTLPDIEYSSRQMSFGYNYVPFVANVVDDRFEFFTQLLEGDTSERIVLKAMRSSYFRNLSCRQSSGVSTSWATVTYRRGNNSRHDETVTADLKEIKLQKRKGGYYMYLPMSHEKEISEVGLQVREYYRSEPSPENILPESFRILGADLGVNIFWGVRSFEVVNGQKTLIHNEDIGSVRDLNCLRRIKDMIDKIYRVKSLIDFRKHLSSTNEEPRRIAMVRYAQSCEYFLANNVPEAQKVAEKERVVGEFKSLSDSDRFRMIHSILKGINHDYRNMRRAVDSTLPDVRKRGVCEEMFHWINLVKKIGEMNKKWMYYGRPPLAEFARNPGFEKHDAYYANLKKDCVKKIARSLIDSALSCGAQVIALEDLDFERSSAKNSKSENGMLAMWSPDAIRNWVNHFANQYGLVVIEVNAAFSSQIDPETDLWGCRHKTDLKNLHVERNGSLVSLHPDLEVAPTNLVNRVLDRTKHVYKMLAKVIQGEDSSHVPVLAAEVAATGRKWRRKEIVHHLKKKYGSEFIRIRGGVVEVLTRQEFARIQTEGNPVSMYRHSDRWFSDTAHKVIRSQLEEKARAAGLIRQN